MRPERAKVVRKLRSTRTSPGQFLEQRHSRFRDARQRFGGWRRKQKTDHEKRQSAAENRQLEPLFVGCLVISSLVKMPYDFRT
jgi:hypothetical protein